MKCSNCGGELIFNEGIGICSNCDSKFSTQRVFEKIDVCICYIENDISGRRTKDSVIANEVYKKLESKNISTFYERVSAANAISENLEMLRYNAFHNAKIIVLVGTNFKNFEVLCEQNKELTNKKIIPVVSIMKPEQLPDMLKGLQAANFDAIGALNDLSVSILNILGRGEEIELEEIYNKKAKKKKTIITVLTSFFAALICVAVTMIIVFASQKEPTVVLTNVDIYNSAIALVNEQKFLEAAIEFNKIIDYKDSSNQIKKIYDRYDGYYQDEQKTCSLYINIIDAKIIELSFEKTINNKTVKVGESLVLENNKCSGKYVDSLQNKGAITITLNSETIGLRITTDNTENELNFGDIDIDFNIKNKTDRPPVKTITKELLLSWISSKARMEDIVSAGYELEFIESYGGAWDMDTAKFIISNTDVILAFCSEDSSFISLDALPISAVIAPAEIVCPEKIGQNVFAFAEGEYIYQPNALSMIVDVEGNYEFLLEGAVEWRGEMVTDESHIQKKSAIGITSKKVIGEENYRRILEGESIFEDVD